MLSPGCALKTEGWHTPSATGDLQKSWPKRGGFWHYITVLKLQDDKIDDMTESEWKSHTDSHPTNLIGYPSATSNPHSKRIDLLTFHKIKALQPKVEARFRLDHFTAADVNIELVNCLY